MFQRRGRERGGGCLCAIAAGSAYSVHVRTGGPVLRTVQCGAVKTHTVSPSPSPAAQPSPACPLSFLLARQWGFWDTNPLSPAAGGHIDLMSARQSSLRQHEFVTIAGSHACDQITPILYCTAPVYYHGTAGEGVRGDSLKAFRFV